MSGFFHDLRYAFRAWRSAPIPIAIAVAALALTIGATVAMFSVVNAILLRPLPFPAPDRIVTLWESLPEQGNDQIRVSAPNFFDWQQENEVFAEMTGFYRWQTTLTGEAEAGRIWTSYSSWRFFATLGVEPILGRTFSAEEDRPDAGKVAVLSHGLWRSYFAADPQVLGRQIAVNDEAHTVLGVLPPGFDFPKGVELWLPLAMDRDTLPRSFGFLEVLGRLAGDVDLDAARSGMDTVARRLELDYPQDNGGRRITLLPLLDYRVARVRPALRLLFASVFLILLIACANVAGLLLARLRARHGEFAVRTALGATRRRLLRQGMVESLTLALVSGALGVVMAFYGVRLFIRLGAGHVPRLVEASLDARVLLFALVVSLAAGLLCGLVPAWSSRSPDLASRFEARGSGALTRERRHVLEGLVVAETALAVLLLVGAGLMLRSFWSVLTVDLGFQPAGVLTMELELPMSRYGEPHQPEAFFRELLERIGALPGVEAASAVSFIPVDGKGYTVPFAVEGRPPQPPGQEHEAALWTVTPEFLPSMGARLLEGRSLQWSDDQGNLPVILVNQTLARRFWPGQSPLGKRLTFEADFGAETGVVAAGPREIVGLIGDFKTRFPDEDPVSVIVFPQAQAAWRSMYLLVRSGLEDPESLLPAIRQQVGSMDPNLPLSEVATWGQVVGESRAERRFSAVLLACLALLGVGLAGVGVFSVTSYTVSEQRREIAVRLTLGARQQGILGRVVRRYIVLTSAGLVAGLGASLLLTRVIASQLFGISRLHPPTYVSVSLLLVALGLAASFLPALRASQIEPAEVLRGG